MDFKPGSTIAIEIVKTPSLDRDIDTLQRLMRLEPTIQRALSRNSRDRRRTTPVRVRAGRLWVNRPRVGNLCTPHVGRTWTIHYRPQLAPDLKRIEKFVRIKSA